MARDRDVQRTSKKRERWRFLQAVRAVSPEQVHEALGLDEYMIGCFLRIIDGKSIIMGVTSANAQSIYRFSDSVLESACSEYLISVGRVFHTDAEADEYCRRVVAESLQAKKIRSAEPAEGQ